MVVIAGETSGAPHPPPGRDGNPQHSPSDHQLGGSIPQQLQTNLGALADDEL